MHSSLFYTFYIAYGDCFHISDNLVTSFPVPLAAFEDKALRSLATQLMKDHGAQRRKKDDRYKGWRQYLYAEFRVGLSKGTIDEIDTVLAGHYGFTAEELDFILNYDIKYRLGHESEEEDE